jgi:isopentenyl diphosphate isomerase/L-lactate dehydrogenase-like FMN-dependent dehydrogenase
MITEKQLMEWIRTCPSDDVKLDKIADYEAVIIVPNVMPDIDEDQLELDFGDDIEGAPV